METRDVLYARGKETGAIRQLQVAEQMCELGNAIELLEKQLDELEQRLSMTVLRDEETAIKGTDAMQKADSLVPHAESIQQRVWHVRRLQDKMVSILRRIEI